MFSAILDVALGLIVLFLILSIAASALSELINNLLQTRARKLEKFIAGTLVNSGIQIHDFYNQTLIAPHNQDGKKPSYIQATDFTEALFTVLRKQFPDQNQVTAGEIPDFTIDELKALVTSLPDSAPLKQVLSSVIIRAKDNRLFGGLDDVARVRASLETWYDNSMERVSGWFKSQTQRTLLIIGLVVAIFFNVDTLAVTNNLLENPGLRSAIAAQAGTISQNASSQIQVPAATPGTSTTATNIQTLEGVQTQLKGLDLPIGWPDPLMPDLTKATIAWWLMKLVGLLITAFAVSQGAPFWFDMLNKVTNLRGSGKPPDTAAQAAANATATNASAANASAANANAAATNAATNTPAVG
jgi:hypothetical protein